MDSFKTVRMLLVALGVLFLPYGIYCFVVPGFLADAAGVAATTATGATEIRAMYGGLQAGFGLFLLAAARDSRLTLGGLAAAAFVMPGLAIARLLAVAIEGGVTGYTIGALVFEIGSSVVAVSLLRRTIGVAVDGR